MKNPLRSMYLPNRFFLFWGILTVQFVVGFFLPFWLNVAKGFFVVFLLLCVWDWIRLLNVKLKTQRILPSTFSLGDENTVEIVFENKSPQKLRLRIIEELPVQFQRRDFLIQLQLAVAEKQRVRYTLRPLTRGAYTFHKTNVFAQTTLGLITRRIQFGSAHTVKVYPSVPQMKKMERLALTDLRHWQGVKKVRRLGHSYEFEQIRNYVKGDDYRSINWKATSRRNELMVNVYQEERAQQVYMVIDKSRTMKMPFQGLSLMDYAINSSLVIGNIALRKHDRAGILSFSDKLGATLKAENTPYQLQRILEALYLEKERDAEASFELLYAATQRFIRRRSLLFLFTNFESYSAMERVLPILRRINHKHLLVVVFFENTEIADATQKTAENVEEVYIETVARQFMMEKQRIVQTLQQYGIQSILTRPEALSMTTVNKYLELKSRGLL